MKQALTIAGSDSGGGAGIQADLKTFHAHGVYGTCAITSVTAQNTVAVTGAVDLPVPFIRQQIDAVFGDFNIAAVKTGMLSSAPIVEVVADALSRSGVANLVVDPVMVSKSGYRLLADHAVNAVRDRMVPLALLVTPNLHEAEILAGTTIQSGDDVREAAQRIHALGCKNVLVKGGHAEFARAIDVLYDGKGFREYASTFIDTRNTHGTGCTFSAAITARLALGDALPVAIERAKTYVTRAIGHGLAIGKGHGPTHHFYFLDPDKAV